MNDPGANPTNSELMGQIEALRRQIFILLLALIVVSCAVATYLCYQSHVMGKSVEGIKPQAMRVIQTYNELSANLNRVSLSNFVSQVSAYAVTHPDYQPVLKKYGWKPPRPAPPRK